MDALDDNFKMPTFELFYECLTREQSKLQQLDALSSSQALVAHSSKGKSKARFQKKNNSAQDSDPPTKPQQKPKSSQPTSKSNRSSSKTWKKRSNETCSFCGKEGHSETKCFQKLEALNEAMKKHNIPVSKPSSSSKGLALSARASHASSHNWIFDSGASHHMMHSKELLPSPSDYNIS